jgi:OOP family OmpA-OmpF porin
MKTSGLIASLIGAVVVVGSGVVCAQNVPKNYGYMTDVNGNVVRNNFGQCWRTGYWTEALAIAECETAVVKQEVPKVEAKPAPQPVAAAAPAAPAPAPVAQPAESWRTTLIEKPVRLEGASFAPGSAKLLPGASSKLDEVVNAANQSQDIRLNVVGYTDSTGSAQKNVKLSQGRADAVKAYLVKKGVAADRISSKGMGADNPIADNTTAEGRAKNRRVEVNYAIKEEQKVRVTQ